MRRQRYQSVLLMVSLTMGVLFPSVVSVLNGAQIQTVKAASTTTNSAANKAITEVTDQNADAASGSSASSSTTTNSTNSSTDTTSSSASGSAKAESDQSSSAATSTPKSRALSKAATVASEQTGTIGTVTWTLGTDGVLHLSGGDFQSHTGTGPDSPWASVADDITSISIDGKITTSTPANYDYLFAELHHLATISGLGNLDMSGVTSMKFLFSNDSALQSVDFQQTDFSSLTDMSYAFSNCKALTSVDFGAGTVDFSKVRLAGSMFAGCSSLTHVDSGNWHFESLTSMSTMFSGDTSLKTVNVANWNTSKVTTIASMFNGCTALTDLDVANWRLPVVNDLMNTFNNCRSLTKLAVGDWQISRAVYRMNFTFQNCTQLGNLDLSSWDTSGVTSFNYTFSNCTSFTALPVENWQVGKANDISYMFNGLNLTTLDLSHWNTSSLTKMGYAFYGMKKLTTLDLSGIDTRKVTTFNQVFTNDTKLQSLTLGANFSFHPGNAATSDAATSMLLPPISTTTASYTGNWISDNNSAAYTSNELMKNYDGSTMAGEYHWEKMGAPVTVNYLDEDGDVIADPTTLTGGEGRAYTATAKTVAGYTLKTTPSNATGKYTDQPVTVTFVYSGNLFLASVPTTIDFGEHALASGTETYGATLSDQLSVQDNRSLAGDPAWTLSVQLKAPGFVGPDNSALAATLYYQTDTNKTPITTTSSTVIASHKTKDHNAVTVSSDWNDQTGLVLTVPSGAAGLGQYQGTINWDLTSGVPND